MTNYRCSNKEIGTAFERRFCEWLAGQGYWVHFLAPDSRGAQPFDVIAAKDGYAVAVDCKTSSRPIFSIERLEENQRLAFEKWLACGNHEPKVAVLYKDDLYLINYSYLKRKGKVDLREEWRDEKWHTAKKA